MSERSKLSSALWVCCYNAPSGTYDHFLQPSACVLLNHIYAVYTNSHKKSPRFYLTLAGWILGNKRPHKHRTKTPRSFHITCYCFLRQKNSVFLTALTFPSGRTCGLTLSPCIRLAYSSVHTSFYFLSALRLCSKTNIYNESYKNRARLAPINAV